MKHSKIRLVAACGATALLLSLSACGQRGPLYLPAPEPVYKPEAAAQSSTPQPAVKKDQEKKDAAPN